MLCSTSAKGFCLVPDPTACLKMCWIFLNAKQHLVNNQCWWLSIIHRYTETPVAIVYKTNSLGRPQSKKTFVVISWPLLYCSISTALLEYLHALLKSLDGFSWTVWNSPYKELSCCKIHYLACIIDMVTFIRYFRLVVPVYAFFFGFLFILLTPLCLRKLIYGQKCWLFRCQMSGNWLALLL